MTEHFLELLGDFSTEVEAKRMFGGVGFFREGTMFALSADEVLFLKVDVENQPEFERAGCEPFSYEKKSGGVAVMSYWSAPEDALRSPEKMKPWADSAWAAAMRKKK